MTDQGVILAGGLAFVGLMASGCSDELDSAVELRIGGDEGGPFSGDDEPCLFGVCGDDEPELVCEGHYEGPEVIFCDAYDKVQAELATVSDVFPEVNGFIDDANPHFDVGEPIVISGSPTMHRDIHRVPHLHLDVFRTGGSTPSFDFDWCWTNQSAFYGASEDEGTALVLSGRVGPSFGANVQPDDGSSYAWSKDYEYVFTLGADGQTHYAGEGPFDYQATSFEPLTAGTYFAVYTIWNCGTGGNPQFASPGGSGGSGTFYTKFTIDCEAPTLVATSQGGAPKVTWSTGNGAAYELCYEDTLESPGEWICQDFGAATSSYVDPTMEVVNSGNRYYHWKVRAQCIDGSWSAFSNQVSHRIAHVAPGPGGVDDGCAAMGC